MRYLEALDEDDDTRAPLLLPADAIVHSDVPYGPNPAQKMDVYAPAGARGAAVIFMVHGGAWMIGDKAASRVVQNKVAYWLPRGIIFISINYRMLPDAEPLQQAEDVASALAYAQANARSWGGDPLRFVLMGHSAGAHLVGLLSADPQLAVSRGAIPWLGSIMLDSAALNVVQIMSRPHRPIYDRVFGRDPAYWRSASPVFRLGARPAPMLLVCSGLREESCSQARAFADKVAALGGKAQVREFALSHRDINQSLGIPGAYTEAVEAFLCTLGIP